MGFHTEGPGIETTQQLNTSAAARPAWYLPTVADILFAAVVLLAMRLGRSALLNDPGTPWHVQVGMDIWRSGPPHVDSYSFTRLGQPWISQYWLCDAAMAVLYRIWSWNGLVLAAALLLGWTYRVLFLVVLDSGANVAWAAALTLLAAGCGAAHWLARPHLLSLFFTLLTFRWCLAYHRSGDKSIWAIVPLTALWCNLHGGFLAGLIVLGCSWLGQALSTPRDAVWRQRVLTMGTVLAASSLATLANPYGWKLHAHLADLLSSSNVRDLIDEWRAPDFQSIESRPLEVLLLLCIVLLAARRRLEVFSLVHLVVWIHFALIAVRHVALAGLIVAPVLGGLTIDLWPAVRDQFGFGGRFGWIADWGRSASSWAAEERAAQWPICSIAVTASLILLTACRVSVPALGVGPAGLATDRWPIAALEKLNGEPAGGPIFNDLGWGGYLILQANPSRLVFVDDRFELYGRDFIQQYLDALLFGPGWQTLLERYGFEHVLIHPDVPLARVLRDSPDWYVLHSDETAILLRRRSVSAPPHTDSE